MTAFQTLNAHRHRYLKLNQRFGYRFAKGFNSADLLFGEFERAALHYPIVFQSDSVGSVCRPVVLLKSTEQGNEFVTEDGVWRVPYVPMVLRVHPFSLGVSKENNQPVVFLNLESELVNTDQGMPLFDFYGNQTPLLQQAISQLNELYQRQQLTEQLCRALVTLKLLKPISHPVSPEFISYGEYYQIDQLAIERLNDAAICLFRRQGWLASLYAHFVSLVHLNLPNYQEVA
jgi:hypothetical protein